MDARALVRSGRARIILWVVALAAADIWLDIPIFVSIPSAFLGAPVYGYFAHERSTRRTAELMAAAAATWSDVELAALNLRKAESENASPATIAESEEAYAAALDRSAIVAKRLADYRALHGSDASDRV